MHANPQEFIVNSTSEVAGGLGMESCPRSVQASRGGTADRSRAWQQTGLVLVMFRIGRNMEFDRTHQRRAGGLKSKRARNMHTPPTLSGAWSTNATTNFATNTWRHGSNVITTVRGLEPNIFLRCHRLVSMTDQKTLRSSNPGNHRRGSQLTWPISRMRPCTWRRSCALDSRIR